MTDYIDKAAAICTAEYAKDENYVEAAKNQYDKAYNTGWEAACQFIKEQLEAAPAADVRPVVRGEWIKVLPENRLDGEYYCSACGHSIDIGDGEETPLDRGTFFCPNCGADMREASHV